MLYLDLCILKELFHLRDLLLAHTGDDLKLLVCISGNDSCCCCRRDPLQMICVGNDN